MTPKIRRAVPGDEGLVLSFVRELADYEKLSHEVVADEAMISAELFCAAPTSFCEIAEVDGAPAAFALWFTHFSTFAGRRCLYLEDLYARPAYRKHGVGKALLRRLAQHCVANGWSRMEWIVLDWNQPAIDFYLGQGAKIASDWRQCGIDGEALAALAKEP